MSLSSLNAGHNLLLPKNHLFTSKVSIIDQNATLMVMMYTFASNGKRLRLTHEYVMMLYPAVNLAINMYSAPNSRSFIIYYRPGGI